ncbi:MAG: SET domain-containing protein-lysine N-methyltransferase [Verrucomicrobiia bacterium]
MTMPSALNGSTVAETALVCLRPSAIHGAGGFAKADIAAGTRVIEYVGEKITKTESLRRCESANAYIFSLDDAHDLDGNVPWNPARFLNHSCDPNCEAEPDGGRVWIVARRGIRAGEEITFNYGYDLDDYRDHPCRCGATGCAGYIVATGFFEYVKRRSCLACDVGQEASHNS